MAKFDVRLESSKRVFEGRCIKVDLDILSAPSRPNFQLEIVRHPGAAAVIPLLSDRSHPDPDILLIHQYRHAAGGMIWEIPAGVLEPGEDPMHCAHRELKEETGATANAMQYLTTIFTTPGFADEQIHLFLASDLTLGSTAHESDEFLLTKAQSLSRVLEMIRQGEIRDSKSLVALLFAVQYILH